jgi:alkaline phosphatase D
MQRYCYARRQSRPEWRELVQGVPVYAIWDDHDFGTNDCWGGPELDEPAWKLPVWELFRQSWANPSYGGGSERPGCWFSFTRGDVDFFLLDGRMYRSDPRLAEPSMLGPEQNAWLREALRESSATFKLICSPVPFEYRTKGNSKDTWNGFRDEREALFDFLAQEAIEGVVLVSADRHRADAWRIEREGAYDLYEFNSSKLTNQHTHPTMAAALFSYNAKQSFGRLLFDTDRPDPVVRYEVWNIDGERVHELELRRSQLR